MTKAYKISLNAIPILLMIALIPLVQGDYLLAGIYVLIIFITLAIKREKNDMLVLVFGFFVMIASEYVFVSTGVETFERNSLFGMMPVWLPFLWGGGFVAIKRSVDILNKN